MLQDLAALTPPLIMCVAFLIGVGFLVRRELAPKRQAARDAAGSPSGRTGSVSTGLDGADLEGADLDGGAAQRSRRGLAAPGEGSAPREAETAPDRGEGSQT